jgi:integrase
MSPTPSTRQQLVKVAQVSCLYRHSLSGTYYGIKKVRGKRKEHSLTTSDRKLAERRLKTWIADLGKVNRDVERLTLREMLERLQKVNRGKAAKTRATDASIIRKFEETWPYDLNMRVSEVRVSQLDEWLAIHEPRLKHTSYNRYAGLLKQLFTIAVDDKVIAESPAEKLKTPWKRPQTPRRHVPTQTQFEAIVENIRQAPYSDTAEDAADFVEFLGLAGVGQAEAAALTWADLNWQTERISIRRRKTQQLFYVPIYPHLRPLLVRLSKQRPKGSSVQARVFKIKDAKAALRSACLRLEYQPGFSQRNLRQCLIQRLWQARINVKLIAKWQGHQDGGKLILDTYTEVFGAGDDSYVQQELAKLNSPTPSTVGMGFITISGPSAEQMFERNELKKLEKFELSLRN